MRIAALYDIHGNLPALDAVLRDVADSRVDSVVIGGDVVPGPMPRECIDRLASLDLPTHFIKGNGDRAVRGQMSGGNSVDVPPLWRPVIGWVAAQLSEDDSALIDKWPATTRVSSSKLGTILFCHATPRNDVDIFTKETPADGLAEMFDATNAALVVCGHTHMQFDRRIGHTRVVNSGSVGMPFGMRGAYWLLLDSSVELKRTHYDFDEAANVIRSTDYPDRENFAARNILDPPSEAEMLAVFSKVPGK